MRRIIAAMAILTAMACGQEPREVVDPYHPKRPAGVPTHMKHGEPIEWDWKRQRAYSEGRIFFHRDSTGGVIAVIIKTK